MKLAPVLQLAVSSDLPHSIWLAGQHVDSMDDLFSDFGLQTNVGAASDIQERSSILKLTQWFPQALHKCYRYIRQLSDEHGQTPVTVVHGDTLSALIGAFASRFAGADVVHIESGLSSKSLTDPFPEELIRRLVFRLTRYALCPNADAAARMRKYSDCEVVDTGENTLLDCVRFAISRSVPDRSNSEGGYCVASIHRFQNIFRRSRLRWIVKELQDAARIEPIRFVLHPATAKQLVKTGLERNLVDDLNVCIEQRMPYTAFLELIAGARAVFTDGGSNQEELSYLGVPTVLYRSRSERPDGLGSNIVFRSQLASTLAQSLQSGTIDGLRRPRRLDDKVRPSETCVDSLKYWAARQ